MGSRSFLGSMSYSLILNNNNTYKIYVYNLHPLTPKLPTADWHKSKITQVC